MDLPLVDIHEIKTWLKAEMFFAAWNDEKNASAWRMCISIEKYRIAWHLKSVKPDNPDYHALRYGYLLCGGTIEGLDAGQAAKAHYRIP